MSDFDRFLRSIIVNVNYNILAARLLTKFVAHRRINLHGLIDLLIIYQSHEVCYKLFL